MDNGEPAGRPGEPAGRDGAAAAGDLAAAGRLLIIGGAEDMCCGAGLLERFVELCGGGGARIVLVTTAHGTPDENTAILVAGQGFEVLGTGVVTVADAQRATVVYPAGDCDPITLFGVRLHLLPAGCVFDVERRAPAIGPAHDRY